MLKIGENNTKIQIEREESKILASFNHKNIVGFKEIYESDSMIFLVMEYLRGGSLRDYIIKHCSENKFISLEECSIIMKQIFEALCYLHFRNFAHRDLKPDNIMFSVPDNIYSLKLIDFGISYKLEWKMNSNFEKSRCGTRLYMAPEQLMYFVSTKVNIY